MDIFKVRSPEEGALAQVVAVQRTPMEGWVFALCLYTNLTYVGPRCPKFPNFGLLCL